MQLVNHDVPEVRKELLPFRMMRQNARMQHIRIGDHNMPLPADRLPRIVGCVTVVGKSFDVGAQLRDQAVRLVHLILRQRFGRENV